MNIYRRSILRAGTAALILGGSPNIFPARAAGTGGTVDIRDFGATGDGTTIDTPAINRAIAYAAERGGGTVWFPPGTYACYTIRLASKITLHLAAGATILAAPAPTGGSGGYDHPDPIDPAIKDYQDFGHSHWKNSLVWGDGLSDVAIVGQGMIWGKGLGRGDGKDNWLQDPSGPGTANKAIGLKNCRRVTIRDVAIREGGWFALLATGVDNLTIANVLVDTNRDGFDIDACKNVHITDCTVNSPYDDAICLKSSYALGEARVTENVTIANCFVSGNYRIGSVIDGTWEKMPADFAKTIHGRIKFGTESNGGYRNVAITNCILEDSRGLAFETVDGGMLEDVVVSNIAMRGIVDAPFFFRLGKRMRGPEGVPIGSLRRVRISNVTSAHANMLPSVIAGLAENKIEDIAFSDIHLQHVGGAPQAMATRNPPENALGYPEATMFGDLPATGFLIRHVRGLEMNHVAVTVEKPDPRPAMWLQDVGHADFFDLDVPGGAPAFALERVSGFRSFGSRSISDRTLKGPVSTRF